MILNQTLFSYKLWAHLVFPHPIHLSRPTNFSFDPVNQTSFSYQPSVNQRWARTPVPVWWCHLAFHPLNWPTHPFDSTKLYFHTISSLPCTHLARSIFFRLFHLNLIFIPTLSAILNHHTLFKDILLHPIHPFIQIRDTTLLTLLLNYTLYSTVYFAI